VTHDVVSWYPELIMFVVQEALEKSLSESKVQKELLQTSLADLVPSFPSIRLFGFLLYFMIKYVLFLTLVMDFGSIMFLVQPGVF